LDTPAKESYCVCRLSYAKPTNINSLKHSYVSRRENLQTRLVTALDSFERLVQQNPSKPRTRSWDASHSQSQGTSQSQTDEKKKTGTNETLLSVSEIEKNDNSGVGTKSPAPIKLMSDLQIEVTQLLETIANSLIEEKKIFSLSDEKQGASNKNERSGGGSSSGGSIQVNGEVILAKYRERAQKLFRAMHGLALEQRALNRGLG